MAAPRRALVPLAIALGIAAAPGSAALAAKPGFQLKIATLAPEGSTWMKLMHELDERVQESTAGQVGFKFYPGGVQGDERIVLRKMRAGQLHGGGLTGNGLGVIAPPLRVLETPFLFESEEEIDAAYAAVGSELAAALEEGGHHLLGWAEVGFVHLFTKRPVRTLPDLKSLKMWLWEGDPLAEAFFAEAGVTPVPLAITDVYTSLQTGLVDGVYSSPYAAVVLQWHSQAKAMGAVPITHAIGAVVVTKAAWEKVPPSHRAGIGVIADDVFGRLKTSSRDENRAAVDDIRKAGLEVVPIAPKDLAVFRDIGARAAQRGVGPLYSAELLQRVRKVVADVRAAPHAAGR
jgi:TRAP-type C4-dicarboxylate transport system substrate-binding protein